MSIERVIFDNLIFNETYGRKVIPFLKEEYFSDRNERIVFNLIDGYVKNYNSFPTKEVLYIDLTNKEGINQDSFQLCKEMIDNINKQYDTDLNWLINQTEKFGQEKSV